MKQKIIVAVTLAALALPLSHAQAAEPLQLQIVMKELGKNMQVITDGISREDWKLVADTAPKVAMHPQPPAAELERIEQYLGANMHKFETFDKKAHGAAHSLEHAANKQDGHQVIAAFQKVQDACLNCHQAFRSKFIEHFYGTSGK